MNKIINDETSNLIILNQYIKDLSYENFQKNGTHNFDAKENNTNIEINVIHEPYGEVNFGVNIKITINCNFNAYSEINFSIRFMNNVNFNISIVFFSIKVMGSIFLKIFVR